MARAWQDIAGRRRPGATKPSRARPVVSSTRAAPTGTSSAGPGPVLGSVVDPAAADGSYPATVALLVNAATAAVLGVVIDTCIARSWEVPEGAAAA